MSTRSRPKLRGARPLSESRIERNGISPGTSAPGFRLPEVRGGTVCFDDYRGRRVLLVFSDPDCEPCNLLAPHLVALHRCRRDTGVEVLLIGRNGVAANRRKAEEHGFEFDVAVQERWELSREYGAFTTPVAFLIDAAGTVERRMARGFYEIADLARTVSDRRNGRDAGPAEAVAQRVAFSVEGVEYRWADVVDAARASGGWGAVEGRARAALAARQSLIEGDGAPPPADVAAAARRFRYERGLLSGDDTKAWLGRRGLTVADWMEHLRRTVAGRQWDADSGAPAATEDAPGVARAAWVDALCDGTLQALAERLAARLAVHACLQEEGRFPSSPPPVQDVRALDSADRQFRAEVAGLAALADELEWHRLDWLRFDMRLAAFHDEDVAREAALLVRVEGLDLPAAAEQAGVQVESQVLPLHRAPAGLRDRLLGCHPGELIGPVAVGDRFLVISIHDRLPPSIDDDEVRRWAEDGVVRRAVRREMERRVVWHDHL